MRAWWRELRASVASLRQAQRLGRQLKRGEMTPAAVRAELNKMEARRGLRPSGPPARP